MKVAITGSHGLIGSALSTRLAGNGDTVVPVRRGPDGQLDPSALDGVDAVVHLAGVGIGDKRWSESHKAAVRDSRLQGTALVARTIAGMTPRPTLLSGSAVGFYGDRGREPVDEASPPGQGYLAELCVEWESATAPAADAGGRVVLLRSGIVLSPTGGALKKQLPLFRFGVGGRLGSGRQFISWITLEDEVAAIEFLLQHDSVSGPVNLTAPHPVTNAEFTAALGRALHRPAVVPVPAVALKVVMGSQMVDEMLLSSANVLPHALERAGYQFAHPVMDEALTSALG
jgi:hypothetical protein